MDDYFEQLVRGGIAPGRARRLLREFEDHRGDIVRERLALGDSAAEAHAAAQARLGPAQDFVACSLARMELRSFSSRRPWAAFAVGPLIAFAALLVLAIAAVVVFVDVYRHVAPWSAASVGAQRIAGAATVFVLWITPLLAAAGVVVLAAGRRQRTLWPIIGVLLIAFLASLLNFDITLPGGAGDAGSIGGGIGISSDFERLASILAYTAARSAPVLLLLVWLRHRRATLVAG